MEAKVAAAVEQRAREDHNEKFTQTIVSPQHE